MQRCFSTGYTVLAILFKIGVTEKWYIRLSHRYYPNPNERKKMWCVPLVYTGLVIYVRSLAWLQGRHLFVLVDTLSLSVVLYSTYPRTLLFLSAFQCLRSWLGQVFSSSISVIMPTTIHWRTHKTIHSWETPSYLMEFVFGRINSTSTTKKITSNQLVFSSGTDGCVVWRTDWSHLLFISMLSFPGNSEAHLELRP